MRTGRATLEESNARDRRSIRARSAWAMGGHERSGGEESPRRRGMAPTNIQSAADELNTRGPRQPQSARAWRTYVYRIAAYDTHTPHAAHWPCV
eukprot:11179745-Lingulodinium_polyedra.AAC.1